VRRQRRPNQRQLRHRLSDLRRKLLVLHLALIAAEQQTYEHIHGHIGSTELLLQLMLKDPWFTWLHPLSDILVKIDLLLNDETFDTTEESIDHLFHQVRLLLQPSVEGDGFERAYYEALQRAPDVVLANFHVKQVLLAEAA
jgi:hypothetical protein